MFNFGGAIVEGDCKNLIDVCSESLRHRVWSASGDGEEFSIATFLGSVFSMCVGRRIELSTSVNYGNFMHGLTKENIQLNRKVLSELSMHEPYSFKALVDVSRKSFPGNKVPPQKEGLSILNPAKGTQRAEANEREGFAMCSVNMAQGVEE
ncbi:hypothetical protein KSP40_PGU005816 [Platanthera guangdongensis]|uniref:Large ribosomal subunit protein bL20c n=1 Tax=Platanthera guangdongensis TaxID=2320717 RepID=A0ABR2MM70_9ASPA